jgi:hypothetical protein
LTFCNEGKYFRFTDAEGTKKERKGCPDRRETERLAVDAEVEAARIRSGMLDPRDVHASKQGRRTLADHLEEFRSYLLSKGGTEKHVALTLDRAQRVIALARGATLARIEAPRTAPKAERDRVASELAALVSSGSAGGPDARLGSIGACNPQVGRTIARDVQPSPGRHPRFLPLDLEGRPSPPGLACGSLGVQPQSRSAPRPPDPRGGRTSPPDQVGPPRGFLPGHDGA